ncbi:hypothetical protein QFZ80_002738 [Paenibacillus sp. V4I7]|nr:hypothetical protein [Paenibacillus sp. V4I7]
MLVIPNNALLLKTEKTSKQKVAGLSRYILLIYVAVLVTNEFLYPFAVIKSNTDLCEVGA